MSDNAINPGILNSVAWHDLSHAYGSADDIPGYLQDLTSPNVGIREAAMSNLTGTIYHQGDIFDSTAAAVPFLVTLVESKITDQVVILEFIKTIADSARVEPEWIRTYWTKQIKKYPDLFGKLELERAERQIKFNTLVLAALLSEEHRLRLLQDSDDVAVATAASKVIEVLAGRRVGEASPNAPNLSPVTPCTHSADVA